MKIITILLLIITLNVSGTEPDTLFSYGTNYVSKESYRLLDYNYIAPSISTIATIVLDGNTISIISSKSKISIDVTVVDVVTIENITVYNFFYIENNKTEKGKFTRIDSEVTKYTLTFFFNSEVLIYYCILL